MERASRFTADMRCGKKDARMFEAVMSTVAGCVEQSEDTTFLPDGERRYGNTLFELCAEASRTGRPGQGHVKVPAEAKRYGVLPPYRAMPKQYSPPAGLPAGCLWQSSAGRP